jgi:hypothetical protein
LPQITAKETIFTGKKIDIDDHCEFYHNKYYFFLQDYDVFWSKDPLLTTVRNKSVKKSDGYEIFSIDRSGRFWRISEGVTCCIEDFGGSGGEGVPNRGEGVPSRGGAKISYRCLWEASNEVRNVGMDRGKRFVYFVDMKRKGVYINTRYFIGWEGDECLG